MKKNVFYHPLKTAPLKRFLYTGEVTSGVQKVAKLVYKLDGRPQLHRGLASGGRKGVLLQQHTPRTTQRTAGGLPLGFSAICFVTVKGCRV